MISFNGITDTTMGLTVKNIERTVLPPVSNRMVTRSGVDGAINFGSDLGVREFVIEFQSKETLTLEELQDKRREVAAWLFPDREEHELTFDDEPDKYYLVKVEGDTDLEQIIEYGSFEATFVCTDNDAISTTEYGTHPITLFTRDSTAYNIDYSSVAVDEPRYYNDGVIVEQEVTNDMANASWVSTSGLMPDGFSEFASNAAGTHATSGSKYTATITSSTADDGFFGTRETPGSWHLFGASTGYSAFVLARVVSGNVKARLKLNVLDSGYSTYYTTEETTSTSFVVLRIESQTVGTDAGVGIGVEAVAITSGDTGVCEFIFPQLEVTSPYNNLWYISDTKEQDDLTFMLSEPLPEMADWSFGITYQSLFKSVSPMGSALDAGIFCLYGDANNYISISWNSAISRFFVQATFGGASTQSNMSATFDKYDEIKYIIRRLNGVWLSLQVNVNDVPQSTGMIYDTRSLPSSIRYVQLGKNQLGVAGNLIMKNIEYGKGFEYL
jgi:predicted phage tail component-like protein